jgi:hypothetical protein
VDASCCGELLRWLQTLVLVTGRTTGGPCTYQLVGHSRTMFQQAHRVATPLDSTPVDASARYRGLYCRLRDPVVAMTAGGGGHFGSAQAFIHRLPLYTRR